mgnify:CR=1 FL=1
MCLTVKHTHMTVINTVYMNRQQESLRESENRHARQATATKRYTTKPIFTFGLIIWTIVTIFCWFFKNINIYHFIIFFIIAWIFATLIDRAHDLLIKKYYEWNPIIPLCVFSVYVLLYLRYSEQFVVPVVDTLVIVVVVLCIIYEISSLNIQRMIQQIVPFDILARCCDAAYLFILIRLTSHCMVHILFAFIAYNIMWILFSLLCFSVIFFILYIEMPMWDTWKYFLLHCFFQSLFILLLYVAI